MRCLKKIAETESLTQAAKALSISQGSVSSSMAQLEKELGLKLFTRRQYGIQMTEAGERVLTHVNRILADLDSFESEFDGFQEERKISIAAIPFSLFERPLVDYLNRLKDDHVIISLESAKRTRILKDVGNGFKTMGIVYQNRQFGTKGRELVHEYGLKYTVLTEIPVSVFLTSNHPLANRAVLTEEDLKPFPEFSFDNYLYHILNRLGESYDPVVERRKSGLVYHTATYLANLVSEIEEVYGYTIWAHVGLKAVSSPEIRVIPYEPRETISFGYIKREGDALSETEGELLDLYKKWLEE